MSKPIPKEEYERKFLTRLLEWIWGEKDPYLNHLEVREQKDEQPGERLRQEHKKDHEVVLAHVFDSHSRCSFAFSQPVLALDAGPNHYAFILSDGTLEIRYADGTCEKHPF